MRTLGAAWRVQCGLAAHIPDLKRRLGTTTAGSGWSCWPRPWARSSPAGRDRKSTRLNSSHVRISYAVFCLKKKKKTKQKTREPGAGAQGDTLADEIRPGRALR